MQHRQDAQRRDSLHQRTEVVLQKTDQDLANMPVYEVQRLMHELRIYQIELEMQNEALRRTQQELETARDRYRTLYDGAPIGYVTLDREGVILEANLAAARLLGTARSEVIRQRLTDFIVPEAQDTFYLHRQQVLAAPTPQACELTMQRQDGTACLIHLESRSELARAEELPQWSTALSDVTVPRALEGRLRETQKMEAIGTLAGGIAHDFNNILTIVIGFTELAQLEVPPASPIRPYLQEVLKGGQRAKELVQQILTFSRRDAPHRQPLKLQLFLQETLRLLRAVLPPTIDIRAVLSVPSGTVLANLTQLQQVLLNLANNAAYAMRATGGVLEIHLDAVDVVPSETAAPPELQPGPYLRLTVQDTGKGMPPHVKARIFEPFFTTKGPGEGTGLGLAVVYGIIVAHAGTITVSSTPGQGTTFTIYLPRTAEEPAVGQPQEEPLLVGTERILFVDDEAALTTLARDMLGRLGYDVTAYASSRDAFAAFREAPQRFDLVITDYLMPGMTGATLAQALRRIRPDLPVILCTGDGRFLDALDAEQTAALGLDAVLMKPITAEHLADTIRHVLARREGV